MCECDVRRQAAYLGQGVDVCVWMTPPAPPPPPLWLVHVQLEVETHLSIELVLERLEGEWEKMCARERE